ncbi:S4 RNA-binding domain protein [Paenibacillus sp. NAIST15-1]|nr:S4 RNA-binding domain protein [Paenibacillus sp. NAIST15-1]
MSLMDKLVSDGHPKYGDDYESFKSFYGKDKNKYFLSGLLYAEYFKDKPINDLQIYFQNNNISISVKEAFDLANKFAPDDFKDSHELVNEYALRSSDEDVHYYIKEYFKKNNSEFLAPIHIYVETDKDEVKMLRMASSTPRYFETYKRNNK